jgi:hypothetical protein
MFTLSVDDEVQEIKDVRVAGRPANSRWRLCCRNGLVESIMEDLSSSKESENFLVSSLCHPHIHLDKCFLLSHPKYADLEIKDGDFVEALRLTSKICSSPNFTACKIFSYSSLQVKQSLALIMMILWKGVEL